MKDLHYNKNNKRDGLQESKSDTYQKLPSSDKEGGGHLIDDQQFLGVEPFDRSNV